MAGFEVSIHLDPVRFEAAITDINEKVKLHTRQASLAAAKLIQDLVQEALLTYLHPREEPTESPPYKGPVGSLIDSMDAMRLHDSITVVEMPVSGFAKVFPDTPYARVQEFGGWVGGPRRITGGGGFTSESNMTYLPPRPYFRPVVMEVDTDPEGIGVERIYWREWRDAMMRAVAF